MARPRNQKVHQSLLSRPIKIADKNGQFYSLKHYNHNFFHNRYRSDVGCLLIIELDYSVRKLDDFSNHKNNLHHTSKLNSQRVCKKIHQ